MKLDPKQTVEGVPILAVRKVLIRGSGGWFDDQFLAICLKLPVPKATRVRHALLGLGYIAPAKEEKGCWRLTPEGARLCATIALRRMARRKAEQHVSALIDRAVKVNANPYYLYRVKEIRVFGSYTTDAPTVGDIDLVLALEPKEPDREKHNALTSQRIRDAMQGGRRFRNIVDELFWPETEVRRFLKQRCAYLRFHNPSDPFGRTEAKQVLFDGG